MSDTATVVSPAPQKDRAKRFSLPKGLLQRYGSLIALLLLLVLASLLSDRFLQVDNMVNVLRQISIVGVLALGMTFVILTAGIDLSVGAILSVVVVYTADGVQSYGILPGVLIGLGVGALLGAVNGLGVTIGRVQPFIMTLGMLTAAKGIALIFSNGQPIPVTNRAFLAFGSGRTLGIPNPAIVFLVLLVIAWFVLARMTFGRSVYAVGANPEAARLSGIRVGSVTTSVYIISGLMAGVAGLLYASQLGVGTPVSGDGKELDAIAATVIGGTSLFGGVGSVGGTFVGAIILGVLSNILNLTGVNPYAQNIFRGAIIVAAVLLQRRSREAK